jgi:hypothetical protein
VFQPSTSDRTTGTIDADGNLHTERNESGGDEPDESYTLQLPPGGGSGQVQGGEATYVDASGCDFIWDVTLTLISFVPA